MTTIGQILSDDHGRCDDFLIAAECAVDEQDWVAARQSFREFQAATLRHLAMEEQVLFASFEAVAGVEGPSQVMRREHQQMRALFADLAQALESRSRADYLGLSETLLMLMQQHNMKEEQMLYPLCDRLLAATREDIIMRMQHVDASSGVAEA